MFLFVLHYKKNSMFFSDKCEYFLLHITPNWSHLDILPFTMVYYNKKCYFYDVPERKMWSEVTQILETWEAELRDIIKKKKSITHHYQEYITSTRDDKLARDES